MTSIFSIRFPKAILVLTAIIAVLLTVFATRAFAQESATGSAEGTAIVFPIADLGQCTDLAGCMDYCEDPINYNSCADYARQNGFYEDDPTTYADEEFWQETQAQLGCNSAEVCFNFCSDPVNHQACDTFAGNNELPGGYTDDPDRPEYLEIAEDVLGCNSAASCRTVCDDPSNQQRCTDFADEAGLLGGTHTEGPGGCQTTQTCQAYCSDPNNFGECSTFAGTGGNFTGPGGCTDTESCHTYCDNNPDECRSYAPGANGAYVPESCPQNQFFGPGGACTAIGDTEEAVDCVGADNYWNGSSCLDEPPAGIDPEVLSAHFGSREEWANCTTPGECYDYCTENQVNGASVCPGFDASAPRPTDDYTPYLYYTPGTEVEFAPVETMGGCTSPASCYDFCSSNPGSCDGFSSEAPRPPEIYIPGTYYTPPVGTAYATPSTTGFYTTPIYYTPPEGSTYTTPQYYTPGMYYTPNYHTPPSGSNYTTPNYYTPWNNYTTPTGEYPTPTYSTPNYYTPPIGTGYTTPYYYTPPQYTTPYYYTPTGNYSTPPAYQTPPPYTTPQYYSPYTGGNYTTPTYYTPPTYSTPTYYTPPVGSTYTSPSYYTPPATYTSPYYYTPGTYPTPVTYNTPPPYTSPTYYTPPAGSTYTSPTYYTPHEYPTPTYYSPSNYVTPSYYSPYITPAYYTPPEGSTYTSPSFYTAYNTPGGSYYTPPTTSGYSYPSPSYVYPSPSGTGESYYTPNSSYTYPSPTDGYSTPSSSNPYPAPPGYGTPSYGTPDSYSSPSYGTPTYDTPSYGTPAESYSTPVQGAQTCRLKLFGICF